MGQVKKSIFFAREIRLFGNDKPRSNDEKSRETFRLFVGRCDFAASSAESRVESTDTSRARFVASPMR